MAEHLPPAPEGPVQLFVLPFDDEEDDDDEYLGQATLG